MVNITFVIGANATGKSYFISQNYEKKDVVLLNVYDYQQREYDVAGYEDSIPFDAQYDCLRKANAALLNDVIEYAKQGRDVVIEQTFFKAKRRIVYIEEIRKNVEATIDVYVMSPDDRLLESNLEKRDMLRSMRRIKRDIEEQLEFPNPAEGFDHIYKIVGSECTLVMKESDPTIVDTAHKELAEEEAYIKEKELEKQERKKLLDSMKTRKFWHYCEVCGKKEFITAKEAHNLGWIFHH